MLTIYRDLGFFMLALVLYDVILAKGVIFIAEACLLLGITLLYGLSIYMTNAYTKDQIEKLKESQDVVVQKRQLDVFIRPSPDFIENEEEVD